MPNWADVNYVVTGDEKQVRDLYDRFQEYIDGKKKTISRDNSNGESDHVENTWLGNVVVSLGGDWRKVYSRGWLQTAPYIDDEGNLHLCVEAAWGELDDWRAFIESKYKGINIYYQCQEPGMDNYTTNDENGKYFFDQYTIELNNDEEYFEDFDDLQDYIKDKTGRTVETEEDVESLINELCEKDEDGYYTFHKFELAD